MSKKNWGILLGILIIFAAIVLFLPVSDPLQGVETVAIAERESREPSPSSQLLQGIEVALEKHRIRIVSDTAQADAIITIEPKEADFQISADKEGFRGSGHAALYITKNSGSYVIDLYVTLDQQGITAKLVTRRWWEVWK